jgi:lipoate-protein ligase A
MKFEEIRVLETGYNSASWNMALDEVLLNHLGDTPILRLYGWTPPAVSIGYFQGIDEEIDVNMCKRYGIEVVRRITGGGSVFHDAELTYSFLTKKFPQNIMKSYEMICSAMIIGLGKLGFCAKFSPLNDITINGKKVSGNAQTRKKNSLLQHGTILLDANMDRMFSVLRVPSEKIRDKMITDARQRIIVLNKTFDETAVALKIGFRGNRDKKAH